MKINKNKLNIKLDMATTTQIENIALKKNFENADYYFIPEFRGPDIYVDGNPAGDEIKLIASILARYGKPEEGNAIIKLHKKGVFVKDISVVEAIDDIDLEKIRV